MKVKLSDLNPNPFKKYLNQGKLDEETIQKIVANTDKLKVMGALPVFKKGSKYFLIAGHHRVEAFKRVFGDEYEVEIIVHDYEKDQVLRGMVIENLTQRMNKFHEEGGNLFLIRDYLRENNILLDKNGNMTNRSLGERLAEQPLQGGGRDYESGSITQICLWLDKNTGDVIKHTKVHGIISVFDKLAPDLLEKVEKASHAYGEKQDDSIGVKDAIRLAQFDNHQEQRDLAKALLYSREQHGNLKQKNLTEYKKAPEEVKHKVRKRQIDIADVKDETSIYNREMNEDHTQYIFTPNFEDRLESFNSNVIELESQVEMFKRVFSDKKFEEKYNKLLPKQREFLSDVITNIRDRLKNCFHEVEIVASRLPNKNLLEIKNEKIK